MDIGSTPPRGVGSDGEAVTRVGTGYRFTDLELMRIEYWIAQTDISLAEMARRLGRSYGGLWRALERRGMRVSTERLGDSWAGV